MNNLLKVLLFWFVCLSAKAGDTNFFPLLTAGAQIFTNATVRSVTATDIIIFCDGGGAKIPLAKLNPELQKRFGYDAAKTAAAAVKQRDQQYQQLNAQRDLLKKERTALLVNVQYDKFDKTTTYRMTIPIVVGRNIDFRVFCVTTEELASPRTVTMHITSESRDWRFLDYHDFVILFDSQRIDKGELEHRGHVGDGGVIEQFFVDFPIRVFKDIAFAKNVEARLGSAEINLGYDQRDPWRIFCEYLDNVSTNVSTTSRP